MTSCFLCKNSKSKEHTVRGFFDKSKLLGQYQEIPEEVDVHISCSLLYKETRLQQVNGNWQVRGLEDILKYQVFSCQNCKISFDWRSSPFVINCHYNECLEMSCFQKNKCSKHHCMFPLDLGCIYTMQVYDIFLEGDEIPCRLKFLCMKHSQKRGGGFNFTQVRDEIMKRFFSNSSNLQQQNQFNYQVKQPLHQPNHIKSGEPLLGQQYDQNAYNQNQGQLYNQQKGQAILPYGNSNLNSNKQQFNQGEMQGYQPSLQQQFSGVTPNQNPQQYLKNSSNQQKQAQTPQSLSNPQVFQKSKQSGQVNAFQNEQFSQHQQMKVNQEYSNNQQQAYQQYDIQGRPVQIPPPSPRMTYQGSNQIPSNNQAYDQNPGVPPIQQTMVAESTQYNTQNSAIPPVQDPYYQQPIGDQQQITTVAPQAQPVGQYKNQQAYRQWDSNSQQFQQQPGAYNPQNPKVPFSTQANNTAVQSIQQQKQGIYKQASNVNQQGYNEDPIPPVNQFNQPKQFQAGQQINQDYNGNNTQQNNYNMHQNQSNQRAFSSNYQSAQFADVGGYNNMYNNDNFGNQTSYERQDSMQQNQQVVGTAIDPVQTHDNTYSFTSNNPPTRLNKQTHQDYQTNTQNNNTPQVQTFTTNSNGRKVMNPNVDTNPNGISVDITDQIKLKQFIQQSKKAQDQQQAIQIQQGYGDNMTENSQYQKTNSTIQSTPGLTPIQSQVPPPPHGAAGDFRNLNQQQNSQSATSNKFNQKQPNYYQNQNYPNSNQYQQGTTQNQQLPYQNNQGFTNQNYQNQQFQNMPNQNFNSNQGQIQQPQNQNVQANYPNNNMNNQQNNNFSYGIQGNGSFAPLQEKPRLNKQPQRERSQQSAQSFNQNDQGNFSVPMYRRPSQQQQTIPQNQQPASIIPPHAQQNQQQLLNDNMQPQFNQNGQQNGVLQAQENDNQMNIEEPNTQASSVAQETVTAAPPTKKRGGKRGKKEAEPQGEVAKLNEVPLKHTKSTQKKIDKKKGKKQTAMEQEEEEAAGQNIQQTHDQQIKDESSAFQQNQNQDNNTQNIQNNNNPQQQQFGSEHNIANKMESQESIDFKSQTSLGIQVQRQNLQIQKDQKFHQFQPQQHIQQNPANKVNQFQPPAQQLTHPQPSQNIIHPPPILSKQSSMQSLPPVSENPQNPIFENQQQIQNNQLPRHPSGSLQPSNIAAQQMNRPQNVQAFKQQSLRPHQAPKKKSGPLINETYKPFFVELVEVQHQIQQYQYQERVLFHQHQQQMMMRHQIFQGQIAFKNNQIKPVQIQSSQNFGQMGPPQLSSQNSGKFVQQNAPPYINQNSSQVQQPQLQVIPPTHQQQQPPYQKVGQQNLVNGANNQQIVQGQLQIQKVNSQNPAHHLHQQQFPQGNLVQPASQDFKNDIGSYHPQNQNPGETSRVPTEQKGYRQQFSNQNFAVENVHEGSQAPLKQNQPIQQNSYPQHPYSTVHQKNNELPNYNNNYIQNQTQNTSLPYPNQFQQGGGGQLQSNLYRDQKNQDFNDNNKKYSNNQINTGTVVTNNLNHSFNPTQNNQYYSQQSNQFSQQSFNLEKQNSLQSLQQQRSISSQQQSYNQQISSQQNLVVPSNNHPSIDQFDQNNMIKSNNLSNLYHNQGVPFRNPSSANLALNATVQHASQTQIQTFSNHGVQNRNPSIQSSEQLFQGPGLASNTNLNLQTLTSLKTLKQIDENVENIREEDIFGEEMTESEESFWDYCSPENYQHLLPQHQSSQNNQLSNSRTKSKLGGNLNNQGATQAQQKQNKKGQAANLSSQSLQKEKDPYFGIDPTKLVVKNFPQGEDEESVFQWWDQIDDVYFPNTIKDGFFNMLEIEKSKNISEMLQSLDIVEVDENGLTKRIPPIKLIQQIQSGVTDNSSLYYLIAKDYYDEEPIPYKHPNYFSVLFYNQINNNDYAGSDHQDNSTILLKRLQQPNNGVLAVFKLKMYDKKKPLTCEDKNIFDKFVSKIEIVPQNNQHKIEDIFQKLDYSLQIQNSIEKQEPNKSKKQSKQNKEKQDLSKYEPEICKQFVGNNQIIPISQLKQNIPAQNSNDFLYDKNKITLKLKKIISLNSSAVYSSFQATNFLNKLQKKQKQKQEKLQQEENQEQDDSDSETMKEYLNAQNSGLSPIECNIFALEYELTKLQTHQQLNLLKENVFKNSKQEGNYLELRNLSVKINDNLKWLTIRKNLILGFSDRQRYDSENYFKYEAEEKSGINLSRSEVLQEKEMLEKMSSTEKENLNQQQLLARQQQQIQRMKRNNQKQDEDEDEEDEDQAEDKSQFNKNKKESSKQNDDNEDEEEDDYNEDDDDGDEEESNPVEDEIKKKEEIKRNSRRSNRIKRILEDENAPNLSNENSIDGLETVQESDRLESPSANRNKDIDDIESDQRKVDQKNKISASSNNKKKKKQKQKSKNKFLEIDCSVCFHHVNNENNTVVYCSQCSGSFHKHCYGIDFIPEERFLCRKCEIKNQQIMKKKNTNSCQKQPLKEEVSKQFHCKLCTETQLPVISIFDDSYFYHPTCLFLFNYAIYKDQRLQLRDTVTHTSISQDIKKQNHIACEFCKSVKGLKVKCCHFGKPRRSFDNYGKKIIAYKKRNIKQNLAIESKQEYQDLENGTENENELQLKAKEQTNNEQEKKENEIKEEDLDKNSQIKEENDVIKQEESEDQQYSNSGDDEEYDELLDENDEDYEDLGCNYYIHPLCAFLNGYEVWLDSRDEDSECEKTIVDSDFQNLQHLGLKIYFKCKEHADRKNRNYDEQVYYRRYQINYRGICQFTTFQEYQQSITKQRTQEEEQWNEINNLAKEYVENYKYYTKIKLNRREIEMSYQQSEQYYQQNPSIREQLRQLEIEEMEEEAAEQKEQEHLMLVNQQNLQRHHSLQDFDEDENIANTNNLIEEGNSLDDADNKNNLEDELDDDEEETSQNKRRSRRHLSRNQQHHIQLSGKKSNQDIQDDYQDQIENEYSQDDTKREVSRRRTQNQKKCQQKAGIISQTSLSGGTGETNKNRRSSRRLVNNNQKGKSQYSNFLNADEEEENLDSSFNQGCSSFENTLNKINLKEFSNSQPIGQDKNSSLNQKPSSLQALTQITSSLEKKQNETTEQEEEFKGLSKKDQKQAQAKQKGKKGLTSRYNHEGDEGDDDIEDEEFGIENESKDEFEDEDFDEEDIDDQKYAQKRGIGKFGRNKRTKHRKNQLKYNQNEQSSSSLENVQQPTSNSRGASPPNKQNGALNNNQEIQKVLSTARSLAKNGKIGKGTSIFAVQNKKRKVQKKIGSRNSLLSIENDEEDDQINETEIHKENVLQDINPEVISEVNQEISCQVHQEDEQTRNQEQLIVIQQLSKTEKEVDQVENKTQVNEKEDEQITNDQTQNSHFLEVKNNTQHQKRSKSPQTQSAQEQVQKQDLEGDNLKLLAQNSDNQQQANQTKYNLRQQKSKNYKHNLIKEDNDFIYAQVANNSQFIKQQQNAFSQFINEQGQIEEETSSNLPQNNQQNKKKQNSQTSIPHEGTPKQKSKKNSKQQSTSQQNTNQTKKGLDTADQEQNDESFSSCVNNNQQPNNQNEIEITNQFSLNSHHSYEETQSNEQKQTAKGKINKKKQTKAQASAQNSRQNKKANNRNKGQAHEQENIQAGKLNESIITPLDHHNNQKQTQNQKSFQINNPNESQELLDFDQFEQKDQILNPNNLKYN